ncbi:hypothetical protein ACH5RR_032678 [Cinchona calisaya]|uniref:DDE Tnp4 domain-containing protein n=1 Tax=Cinchona calisaya TaxID=153742 RepID=A0ABD2YKT0_9GENT
MKHASARNVIERCFGLLKIRWNILKEGPTSYPIKTQNRIIMACCLLHNFIHREMLVDPRDDRLQAKSDSEEDEIAEINEDAIDTIETSTEWNQWRENLALSMYNEWKGIS